MKDKRWPKHHFYKERVRELGLLSLKKRNFWGDVIEALQYLEGPAEGLWNGSSGSVVIGQRTVVLN